MKNVEMYIKERLRSKAVGRRVVALGCALSLLLSGGIFWKLHRTGSAETVPPVYCGLEEHTHEDACVEKTLICGMGEAHTHSDACYAEQQILNCTEEHEHTDACFSTEQTLVCSLPENEHVHTDACYETALVCGLEEHQHTTICYVAEKAPEFEGTDPLPSVNANDNAVEPAYDNVPQDGEPNAVDSATIYLFGSRNNNDRYGITARYTVWGLATKHAYFLLRERNQSMTITNDGIVRTEAENLWSVGANNVYGYFEDKAGNWWFYISGKDMSTVVNDGEGIKITANPFKKGTVYVDRVSTSVLDTSFIKVKIATGSSVNYEYRTVEVYKNGALVTRSASLPFPDRGDLDASQIVVTTSGKQAANCYYAGVSFPNGTSGTVYRLDYYDYSHNLNFDQNCSDTVTNMPSNQAQGASAASSKTFTIGSNTPVRTGYTFAGWSETPTGAVKYQPSGTITLTASNSTNGSTSNVTKTLYAQWTVNSYTASATAGTGIQSVSGSGTYNYNASVPFTATLKEGYIFDGWYNGSTKVSSNISYTFPMPASNVTYTATAKPQTYTIDFDYNGGIDAGELYEYMYNIESVRTLQKAPTKEGYTFVGWKLETAVGNWDAGLYPAEYSFSGKYGNVLFVAQWEQITYAVTYDANGGSNAPAAQSKIYGTALTLSSVVPVRTGYTFTGWNTAANGSGTAYASGASYTADANVTLYAQWAENTVTITYEAALGGTVSLSSETVGVVTGTLQGSTATANTGYTFAGWYDASGALVSGNASFKPTSKTAATYTAKFTENTVTITYKAETGGTVSPETETVGVVTGTVQGSTAAANDGYIFDGWYNAAGERVSSEATYRPEKATAAYTAKFKENVFTITYVAQGEGGSVAPTQETIGADAAINGSSATAQTGYRFSGWYVLNGDEYIKVADTSKLVPTERRNSTYYALFEPDYTVTKELSYTVRHIADGVLRDTETVTETVWLHTPVTALDIRDISLKDYLGYQYDSNSAALTLNDSVLIGSGTIADGGVIEVNYTAVESIVKVTMIVNGKLADKTLPFSGNIHWSCGDGSSDSLPFRLVDGADVSSAVIKAGVKLSVSLDSADSTYQLVSVTVNGVEYTDPDSLSDLPFVGGENTVAIAYERPDGPPDTGINIGSLTPMFVLLAITAVCGGALLVGKKRRDAEG